MSESNDSRDKVADSVRQIRVVFLREALHCHINVLTKRSRRHQEIARAIRAEFFQHFINSNHVSDGFAHFSASRKQVPVCEKKFWKFDSQLHQHDRPDGRVNPQDIFTDQLNISRPLGRHFIRVPVPVQTCEITQKASNQT